MAAQNGVINLYEQTPISCAEPRCCPVQDPPVLIEEINNNELFERKTPFKTILKKAKNSENRNFFLDETESSEANDPTNWRDLETRSSTPYSNRLTFSTCCQEMTQCSSMASVYFNDRMSPSLSDKHEDRISSFVELETEIESLSSSTSSASSLSYSEIVRNRQQQRRHSLSFRYSSPLSQSSMPSSLRRHSDLVSRQSTRLSVEECPYLITESNIIGSSAEQMTQDDDLGLFSVFGW